MSPRVVLALGLLLLPLLARAAPPEVERRLLVLEPVTVSEHHGSTHGHGFKLTFQPLRPDPALARFAVEDARVFVAAMEAAFPASKPRSGRSSLPEVPKGGLWARFSPPRSAFAGGGKGSFSVGAGTRAQVSVADGTVVLMGVSANVTASAAASAGASARTTGACRDASEKGDAKRHHLATDKNDISDASGGPWTPRFKNLFDRAGMSLDEPANIVYLIGHMGPHPKEYHAEVFRLLRVALGDCQAQADCRSRLISALDRIAGEICTSGSKLNKLATREP